jgi:hypothetical protein
VYIVGNRAASAKRIDTNIVGDGERIDADVECMRASIERLESGCDILRARDLQFRHLEP